MVADQVTCISCTSGNCTPFGGYYTVHIGSTQHTTGYMYANTGPIRDGIKPGWQGPLHLPQDFGWRWGTQKLKKKKAFWRPKPPKNFKKKNRKMMLMLQKQEPSDYVIATGESCSLAEFIAEAFDAVGLNWQDFVRVDTNLMRPTDLALGLGNPHKAKLQLGWEAKYRAKDVVKMMVKANFERN